MSRKLVCTVCGREYTGAKNRYVCPRCQGSIGPYMELSPERSDLIEIIKKGSSKGIWGYRALLNVDDDLEPVTMGEGNTPLLKAESLGEIYGLKNLYLKNETKNPTSSYKDRFASLDISLKKAAGAKSVALGSAGNAGCAVAAYAAKAGLICYLLLADGAVRDRAKQAMAYGARFIRSEGNIDDFLSVTEEGVKRFGWANSATTMLHNPYSSEGYKTIAYELGKDLDFKAPDWVLCPIGGGILISKVWRGFNELYKLGLIDKLPKMVGVQASGCAPVVRAIGQGAHATEFWENSGTVATSIDDPVTFEGVTAPDTIRKSGGLAIAVDDEDTVEAMRLCARTEAVMAEPASATTLAAVKKMRADGIVKEDDVVVCIITGSALRDLELMMGDRAPAPRIGRRNMEDCAAAIEYYESLEN